MKSKKVIIAFVSLLLIIIVSVTLYFIRPIIYYPEETIHDRLLKDTPIGSNKQFVLEYVKKKCYTFDITQQGSRDDKWGSNYMRVSLGHYQGVPWKCDVGAVWVFDANDKLLHIDVWKDYDAL